MAGQNMAVQKSVTTGSCRLNVHWDQTRSDTDVSAASNKLRTVHLLTEATMQRQDMAVESGVSQSRRVVHDVRHAPYGCSRHGKGEMAAADVF